MFKFLLKIKIWNNICKEIDNNTNKENIRTNLSKVITDNNLIDQAMQKILNEREVTTIYKLTKVKNK